MLGNRAAPLLFVVARGIGSGLILQPSQAATLTISFAPAGEGQATGTVPLASDAWSTPAIISLSGTGVDATVAAHAARLVWEASPSAVAGYNAYRGTHSGGPYAQPNSSLLSGTSYADTTVASGQMYFYVVASVDSLGTESDYSNEVSATIPSDFLSPILAVAKVSGRNDRPNCIARRIQERGQRQERPLASCSCHLWTFARTASRRLGGSTAPARKQCSPCERFRAFLDLVANASSNPKGTKRRKSYTTA